ncbi:MAG TPA: c(7)-type cytochrome triheme domain-containing protein [Nitrospiria bacterium]|nr:c(7)-type cytochrome triheme domain-containing protein [Nitrospiria bacterium]
MRKDNRKPFLTLFRHPSILVLVLLIGCGGLIKSGSDKDAAKTDKAAVKSAKTEAKKAEKAKKEAAEAEKKKAQKVVKAEAAETEKPKPQKVEASKTEKKKTASAAPAKRSSRSNLPCDPVMVSGITGECAGTGAPGGVAGEAFQEGLKEHPIALEESLLPKDRFGLIDWADAIKAGNVKPLHDFDPKKPDMPQIDMDVVVFTKSQFMPDVIFPHKIHTMWLTCTNCHPSIFPMNAKQANAMMTMPKIAAGEFCGKCHNRVAFPLSDCERCHIKPRNVPPIDPDAAKWNITPIEIPN